MEIDRQIQRINGKYDIHILKVAEGFHIKNLYPVTDQVEKWSVFVIGNDMTYIHASVGDFHVPIGSPPNPCTTMATTFFQTN